MDYPEKVEDDMDMEVMADTDMKYYVPQYAPAFYYPRTVVQYPTKTTITQRVSPWYQVPSVQYPFAYPGLVSQVGIQQVYPPEPVTNERILPTETQEGEDVSAALLL